MQKWALSFLRRLVRYEEVEGGRGDRGCGLHGMDPWILHSVVDRRKVGIGIIVLYSPPT